MSTWKTVPNKLPADGEIVWVRLNYWFGEPFLAKWKETSQVFIEQETALLMQYPFWTISRWRSQ